MKENKILYNGASLDNGPPRFLLNDGASAHVNISTSQQISAACRGGSPVKFLGIVTCLLLSHASAVQEDRPISSISYTDYTRNPLLQQVCRPLPSIETCLHLRDHSASSFTDYYTEASFPVLKAACPNGVVNNSGTESTGNQMAMSALQLKEHLPSLPKGTVIPAHNDSISQAPLDAHSITEHINIIVIGAGPHSRRVYLPLLANRQDVSITVAIDLFSQKSTIDTYLDKKGLKEKVPMKYIEKFDPRGELPEDLTHYLEEVVAKHGVKMVIIATEPTAHICYGKWAIRQRLNIILDKPISVRSNSSCDIKEARGIWHDYQRLADEWEKVRVQDSKKSPMPRPTLITVNVQRRYHTGFEQVIGLVREVSELQQMAVTSVSLSHSDGQHRLPQEMKDMNYHPYNDGYGKIGHSGYHIIDLFAQIFKAGESGLKDNKKLTKSFVVQATAVYPSGAMNQRNEADYQRDFGKVEYDNSHSSSHLELNEEFARGNYGEIDALIQINHMSGNDRVAISTINLKHSGFSRRSWLEVSPDLYKGNGRVKHESHTIDQGNYQRTIVESYQSSDKHDDCLKTSEGIPMYDKGGHDHFEITNYRVVDLYEDKQQRILTEYRPDQESSTHLKLRSEKAKGLVIDEMLDYIRGTIELKDARSHLTSHSLGVQIMSAAYESLAIQRKDDTTDPRVTVRVSPAMPHI